MTQHSSHRAPGGAVASRPATAAAAARVPTGRPRRRLGASRVPLWFLAPGIVLYAGIVLVPSVVGAAYSFTDSEIGAGGTFVGFGNYVDVFSDASTVGPLTQTLAMAAGVMIIQ